VCEEKNGEKSKKYRTVRSEQYDTISDDETSQTNNPNINSPDSADVSITHYQLPGTSSSLDENTEEVKNSFDFSALQKDFLNDSQGNSVLDDIEPSFTSDELNMDGKDLDNIVKGLTTSDHSQDTDTEDITEVNVDHTSSICLGTPVTLHQPKKEPEGSVLQSNIKTILKQLNLRFPPRDNMSIGCAQTFECTYCHEHLPEQLNGVFISFRYSCDNTCNRNHTVCDQCLILQCVKSVLKHSNKVGDFTCVCKKNVENISEKVYWESTPELLRTATFIKDVLVYLKPHSKTIWLNRHARHNRKSKQKKYIGNKLKELNESFPI
jgi:hypothetical protein